MWTTGVLLVLTHCHVSLLFLTLWIAAACRWGGEFKTTQGAAQDLAKTAQSRGLKVELKTMDEAAIRSGDHGDHGGPDCDPRWPRHLGQFWLQFWWNMRWINGCLGRWNRPHHLSSQVSPKDLVAGKIKSLAFSAPTRCRWIGSGAGVICRLNFLKWNELIRSNSNWLGPMMVGTRGCSFHFLTLHRTILGCCGWSQDWWSDPCGSHHGRDASLSWVGVNTDGP
jgi:hypothetical protein